MNARTRAFLIAAATLLPTTLFAQTPSLSCRPLEPGNTYIEPDEKVIGNQVCKIVSNAAPPTKPAPAAPPAASNASKGDVSTASPDPNSAPTDPNAELTTPSSPPAVHRKIVLEDNTPVRLVLGDNLSSASATTGQTISFEVSEDVVVDGMLVIPRGSLAWGTVTDAQAKRRLGRAGHLDVNIDKVRLADGERVLLSATSHAKGGSHTGAMTAGIVATSLVVWPAAPFFLFMHGKDVTIPKGTKIEAFTNGDANLDAANFPAAPRSATWTSLDCSSDDLMCKGEAHALSKGFFPCRPVKRPRLQGKSKADPDVRKPNARSIQFLGGAVPYSLQPRRRRDPLGVAARG